MDRQTNNATLVELIEEITAPGLPLLLPQLSVVWLLRRDLEDPQEWDAQLRLTLNQTVLGVFPIHVNFLANRHFRSVATLQGLVITDPGELKVVFLRDGAEIELATQSVIVNAAPPVVAQVEQGPGPQ